MVLTSNTVCDWANASVPARMPMLRTTVRWTMCLYPNARMVDYWISRMVRETGSWEPGLVRLMLAALGMHARERPVLVDVGANIGFYTLAAAASGYEAYSFEPVPRNVEMLRQSIVRNRFGPRVTLHAFAAGAVPMTLTMGQSAGNQGGVSHTRSSRDRAPRGGTQLAALPVDDATHNLTGRPVYLKVDVEGAECDAFRGMRALLARSRIVGANLEMQRSTRRCCKEEGWNSLGGPFHTLHHVHGLCPGTGATVWRIGSAPSKPAARSVTMPWQMACNDTGPWDLVWMPCP